MPINQITIPAVTQDLSTVIGLLTSTKKVDVVKILNQQTMAQVFNAARPMKATVKETSKVSKYPVETGYTSMDNRVSLPTEIEMDMFIPASGYSTVYPQIRNAWQSGLLLSVQTRTGTYKNMIIENMPHDEDTDIFNGVMMHIKFSEFIMAGQTATGALANFSPAKPQAANTLNSGLTQALAFAGSISSYLHAGKTLGL